MEDGGDRIRPGDHGKVVGWLPDGQVAALLGPI
jgi:hypothetical protein